MAVLIGGNGGNWSITGSSQSHQPENANAWWVDAKCLVGGCEMLGGWMRNAWRVDANAWWVERWVGVGGWGVGGGGTLSLTQSEKERLLLVLL